MIFCTIETKDILDLSLKLGTLVFVGLTALKALNEFKYNREQRKLDIKWKQAEAAKNLIDEWMDDEEAYAFCKMVEYENRKFRNEDGHKFISNTSLIKQALGNKDAETNSSSEVNERYIRDVCDSFLYYTELMHQRVKSNLYLLKNLRFPLNYYLGRMKEQGIYDAVVKYASESGINGSIILFNKLNKSF